MVCVSNHIRVTLQTSGVGYFGKSYLSKEFVIASLSHIHVHTFLWNKLALNKLAMTTLEWRNWIYLIEVLFLLLDFGDVEQQTPNLTSELQRNSLIDPPRQLHKHTKKSLNLNYVSEHIVVMIKKKGDRVYTVYTVYNITSMMWPQIPLAWLLGHAQYG